MDINDRHGNPLKLNNLYVDYDEIRENRNNPFPINYTNGLCKITKLNLKKPYLEVQYEVTGSSVGGGPETAAALLGKRLIPLNKKEVTELIKDRKRRLSFLEESAQVEEEKIFLPGHSAP